MATAETETTMTLKTADGESVGPVPLSALESATERQLTLFEGQAYPDTQIRLSGGVDGLTVDFADLTGLRVGDDFTAQVKGVIAAKKHSVKFDEDGNPTRILTIQLKADDVRSAG